MTATAAAGNPYTPPPGSVERKAICDALRIPVIEEFGLKPIFVIQTLVVMDGWAFLSGDLQREDGTSYRAEEIYTKLHGEGFPFDGDSVYGLLRKQGKRWKALACVVGPTDVAYADWRRRFGAPRAVFGPLATNVE